MDESIGLVTFLTSFSDIALPIVATLAFPPCSPTAVSLVSVTFAEAVGESDILSESDVSLLPAPEILIVTEVRPAASAFASSTFDAKLRRVGD